MRTTGQVWRRPGLAPDDTARSPGLLERLQALRSGATRDPFNHHTTADGRSAYGVLVPMRLTPWVDYMGVPEDYFDGMARHQLQRAAVVATLLTCVLALASLLAARWITRPIRDLAALAVRWGQGELELRGSPSRLTEVDELGTVFNAMAARLETYAGSSRHRSASAPPP